MEFLLVATGVPSIVIIAFGFAHLPAVAAPSLSEESCTCVVELIKWSFVLSHQVFVKGIVNFEAIEAIASRTEGGCSDTAKNMHEA